MSNFHSPLIHTDFTLVQLMGRLALNWSLAHVVRSFAKATAPDHDNQKGDEQEEEEEENDQARWSVWHSKRRRLRIRPILFILFRHRKQN